MKRIFLIGVTVCVLYNTAFCQQEISEVIDTPTANSIGLGSFSCSTRLYGGGSILTRLFYGIIMDGLTLGLSFDAENVIGTEDINPHRPYLYIKFPLYRGNQKWPVIGLGFDEQGLGAYDEDTDKYQVLPMGFFLVFTKLGLTTGLNFSVGANANYSVVPDTEERILGFCNADFMLGPEFMLIAEVKEITAWDSFVNAGARYFLNPELSFEFSGLNLGSRNGKTERIIKVTYTKVWGEF